MTKKEHGNIDHRFAGIRISRRPPRYNFFGDNDFDGIRYGEIQRFGTHYQRQNDPRRKENDHHIRKTDDSEHGNADKAELMRPGIAAAYCSNCIPRRGSTLDIWLCNTRQHQRPRDNHPGMVRGKLSHLATPGNRNNPNTAAMAGIYPGPAFLSIQYTIDPLHQRRPHIHAVFFQIPKRPQLSAIPGRLHLPMEKPLRSP